MNVRAAALGVGVAVLVAAGSVLLGRASVDTHAAREQAYGNGYADGLRAGVAQGKQEGRALQEGESVVAGSRQPVRDAFTDGYRAGSNDVFAGYDGGWELSTPYVITLERGSGQISYRIGSRERLADGADYYLCAGGHRACRR